MKSGEPQPESHYEEFEKSDHALREEQILQFWAENNIFTKSLQKESPAGEFIFYEGPPTANGRPGIHHLESRAFKDAIPRYKTMRGYHVPRRAGWDTHGLPVELEVEKQLGFTGKPDIERYGIAKFNEKCKESVFTYVKEWIDFTNRIGYWLDHDSAYYTFNPDFMESVWWVFAQSHEQGLLYKDYKVLPWCSRCGTALSSHELAQGYEDVKDLSVTAEFRVASGDILDLQDNIETSILAWTTTPWTLPGNVALAVGKDIKYVLIEKMDEGVGKVVRFVVAKDLVEKVFPEQQYKVVKEFTGDSLVGTTYVPLYSYFKDLAESDGVENLENAYQIYGADFVTTEDGTGIVHTAVMYGQDDFELGNEVGLPKFHLVDAEGHFIAGTDFLEGRFVKDETVAIDIIKNLAHRELLFSKEKYEHSYPFCWRCKTPLIYYARDSWYIRMSDLRDKLLANNDAVNWEPDYIKEGRMASWLAGAKDWAVSRERYWGTPLPIWESNNGDIIVVDSINTLKQNLPATTFVLMRHGEAEHNLSGVAASSISTKHNLTDQGIAEIKQAATEIKKMNPDMVIASPLHRAQETSRQLINEIGLSEFLTDEQVTEIDFGIFAGKSTADWHDVRVASDDSYTYRPENGESFLDLKQRVSKFLTRMATAHPGKVIVVVTHGGVLEVSGAAADGYDLESAKRYYEDNHLPGTGEYVVIEKYLLPLDESEELNLHRPYIDDVVLEKDGMEYRRVPEVLDVWFDSGSMPYAQDHYPFENKDYIDNAGYPADYISEAIDQTRGWFYTLQAIATYLGRGTPYKNVVCLGHILDAEGQKMSKSRGNAVNPWKMIAMYGADALRFWMYSVNQPGEPKNFDEKTVDEIVKKVFNLLRNSLLFYQLFSDHEHAHDPLSSPSVLDQWLISRLAQTSSVVTSNLDNYKLLEATRAIRDFIGDLSQWYVRRSRERLKGSDDTDRSYALATMRYVLQQTAKLLAPFTPYLAEEIWQQVRDGDGEESVHLSNWTDSHLIDQELISAMNRVRELASVGLALRTDVNINVRQPLASFTHTGPSLSQPLNQVLAEELNVKAILVGETEAINTKMTPELKAEGELRELLRNVQSLRKKYDLVPADRIALKVNSVNTAQADLLNQWQPDLLAVAGITSIVFDVASVSASRSPVSDGEIVFDIEKL